MRGFFRKILHTESCLYRIETFLELYILRTESSILCLESIAFRREFLDTTYDIGDKVVVPEFEISCICLREESLIFHTESIYGRLYILSDKSCFLFRIPSTYILDRTECLEKCKSTLHRHDIMFPALIRSDRPCYLDTSIGDSCISDTYLIRDGRSRYLRSESYRYIIGPCSDTRACEVSDSSITSSCGVEVEGTRSIRGIVVSCGVVDEGIVSIRGVLVSCGIEVEGIKSVCDVGVSCGVGVECAESVCSVVDSCSVGGECAPSIRGVVASCGIFVQCTISYCDILISC